MKQKQFAKRWGTCFVVVLCLMLVINLLWPDTKESTIENRSLQQFPTWSWQNVWDGQYQSSISTWFADQFVGRNVWIHGRYLFLKATQNKKINDVFLAKGQLIQDSPKPYWSQINRNIKAINTLAQNTGIPTSFVLAPTALSIQKDKIDPAAISYDQNAMTDRIDKKLDTSIQTVDVRKRLKNSSCCGEVLIQLSSCFFSCSVVSPRRYLAINSSVPDFIFIYLLSYHLLIRQHED